jgi:indolepyruvate ferredoxin oxidoreductase beta subunit
MKTIRHDPLNLVICGIGGQGNVLASELLGSVLVEQGWHVAVGETYGASQRGGSVMSHVRISADKELGVLIGAGQAHIILGFEPLETLRMARRYGSAETEVIYDPRAVYPLGVLQGEQTYPDEEAIHRELTERCGRVHRVRAAELAMEAGDSKAANIALMGALTTLESFPLSPEDVAGALRGRFSGKVLSLNEKAFDLGRQAMSEE